LFEYAAGTFISRRLRRAKEWNFNQQSRQGKMLRGSGKNSFAGSMRGGDARRRTEKRCGAMPLNMPPKGLTRFQDLKGGLDAEFFNVTHRP
jgi:hypothetical protein